MLDESSSRPTKVQARIDLNAALGIPAGALTVHEESEADRTHRHSEERQASALRRLREKVTIGLVAVMLAATFIAALLAAIGLIGMDRTFGQNLLRDVVVAVLSYFVGTKAK